MKTLVLYYSLSGRTKTVAEAIYVVAEKKSDAELSELKDFTGDQLDNYDLVFVGSPCHDADIAKPIKQLLENIPEKPQFKLACFVTHSCSPPEQSDYMAGLFETWVGKCTKTLDEVTSSKGINYVGYFRCMGAPSPAIENFIHTSIVTDEKEFQEYVVEARKHPDKLDVKNAQEFAEKIIKEALA
ncbi:MAG: flavodoxin family protein [Candidatus Heimdallarchaeota archaeon]